MAVDRDTAVDGIATPVMGRYVASPSTLSDGEKDIHLFDAYKRLYVVSKPREITLLTSVARTATATGSDTTNVEAKGLLLFLDITVVTGTTPTLDLDVQWKDPVASKYITIGSFAQQTGTGTLDLLIYPGTVESANRKVSHVLPVTWRLNWTIGGTATPTFTFSVGANYLY